MMGLDGWGNYHWGGGGGLITTNSVVGSRINGFVFIFVLGSNYILHVWEISAI